MASSGPNSPSTVVSDSTVGTEVWSNPSNATASDNNDAIAVIGTGSGTTSEYLKATNFGFAIPSGATIDGVEFTIEYRASQINRVSDNAVRIVKGGTIGSTDKSEAANWPTSETTRTYGGPTDTWGETLTDTDINATTFGFAISAIATGSGTRNAEIDHITCTVYYTAGTTYEKTGSATATFVGSGASDYTPQYIKTGSATATFVGSGVSLYNPQYLKTGGSVATFIGSGDSLYNPQYIKTGEAIATLIGSGLSEYNDQFLKVGSAIATMVASGASEYNDQWIKIGAAIATLIGSGTYEYSSEKTGAAIAKFLASGASDYTPPVGEEIKTGSATATLIGSGASEYTPQYIKIGEAIATMLASGASEYNDQWIKIGEAIATMLASGTSEYSFEETGSAIATMLASGASEYTSPSIDKTGSATTTFIGSGTSVIEYTKTGSASLYATASGVSEYYPEITYTKTGDAIMVASGSGSSADYIVIIPGESSSIGIPLSRIHLIIDDDTDTNYTNIESLTATTNEHGFETLIAKIKLNKNDIIVQLNQPPFRPIHLISNEGFTIFKGRIEKQKLLNDGVEIEAYGTFSVFTDVPVKAMWSDSKLDNWEVMPKTIKSSSFPERFEMKKEDNSLYIGVKNGETYGNTTATKNGFFFYRLPHLYRTGQDIVGISFEYENNLESDWNFVVQRIDEDNAWLSNIIAYTNGNPSSGVIFETFTGCAGIQISIYRNAADAAYTNDTGDVFVRISNIRLVTAHGDKIDTTLNANISPGSNVITPSSGTAMTNIFLGQKLIIDAATADAEVVEVTALTSTTFTATFANSHTSGDAVNAFFMPASRIIQNLTSTIIGRSQLENTYHLIENGTKDITDYSAIDVQSDVAIKELVNIEYSGTGYIVGVWEDNILFYKPKTYFQKEWFIDLDFSEIIYDATQLFNRYYTTYKEKDGRDLRTSLNTNTESSTKYLLRSASQNINTTDLTSAEALRDALLNNNNEPSISANITIHKLYDSHGIEMPKYLCRAGDKITVRNIPQYFENFLDQISSFTVSKTLYDPINNTMTITPEQLVPSIEYLLSTVL